MKPDTHWLERAQRAGETAHAGTPFTIELLPPHGSQRRYARLHIGEGDNASTEILMLLPDSDAGPAEAGGSVTTSAAEEPFIAVAKWLEDAGVLAPRVHGVDEETLSIRLNDLGRFDLDQAFSAGKLQHDEGYQAALELLDTFQRAALHPSRPALTNDRALHAGLLRWELEHYVEWRLQKRLGVQLNDAEREALDIAFAYIVDALTALPQTTIHRDFQSHNLMVLEDKRLALIDFQDALQGPLPYDAVALLRDSYIELDDVMLTKLVDTWAQRNAGSSLAPDYDKQTLVRAFHIQTIQRKMKDTGRFDLFDLQQNKPGFLQYQPASVRYIRHALQTLDAIPELRGLTHVLQTHEPLFV